MRHSRAAIQTVVLSVLLILQLLMFAAMVAGGWYLQYRLPLLVERERQTVASLFGRIEEAIADRERQTVASLSGEIEKAATDKRDIQYITSMLLAVREASDEDKSALAALKEASDEGKQGRQRILSALAEIGRASGKDIKDEEYVTSLLTDAAKNFGSDPEKAAGLLATALVVDPVNASALDMYRDQIRIRLEQSLERQDWSLAHAQVMAYDTVVRAALQSCRDRTSLDALLVRQQRCRDFLSKTLVKRRDDAACQVLDQMEPQLPSADAKKTAELIERAGSLSFEGMSEATASRIAGFLAQLNKRGKQLSIQAFQQQVNGLVKRAEASEIPSTDLQVLHVQAEKLHGELVNAQLDGLDVTQPLALSRDLLAQIGQRLQVASIRQMQTIADADAMSIITQAQQRIDQVTDPKNDWYYCQWLGTKLAEAETLLLRIDRLTSQEIQDKSHSMLEQVRREALDVRNRQRQAYNKWAIDLLDKSIVDYRKAKGLFDDDEAAFMKELEEIGRIDPQYLHPVVYTLYAESYQKFLSELDVEDKVKVTRAVEGAKRRALSDF